MALFLLLVVLQFWITSKLGMGTVVTMKQVYSGRLSSGCFGVTFDLYAYRSQGLVMHVVAVERNWGV